MRREKDEKVANDGCLSIICGCAVLQINPSGRFKMITREDFEKNKKR